MKVVYLHQHFTTNRGSSGTRSYDVSRHLLSMGHEVTMICGLFELGGLDPMPSGQLFRRETIDGIEVISCNVPYANKMKVPQRIAAFFGYAALATVAALREDGTDVVFGTSTPLTVGLPSRIAARLKRVPYVFEVRDLWPEDLVAAGRLEPGLKLKFWEWLERYSYGRAEKILLVSKGFHDRLLERGMAPDRLRTLLLGGDGRLFENLEPNHEWLKERGLEGKTVALYCGAHGDANGLSQLLDAAELLLDREDIALLLIGAGGTRDGLMEDAARRGLSNVHFHPAMPKKDLVHIIAACDIGLMLLKQIVRPRWVTPNKLFDYMFAGLPVLVNFAGTTAEIVEEVGAGAAVDPGSAQALADQVRAWADEPETARAVGKRAREVAYERFERRAIAEGLAEVLQAAVDGYRKRR